MACARAIATAHSLSMGPTHFRHNLTTLEFDTYAAGWIGDDAAGSVQRGIERICADRCLRRILHPARKLLQRHVDPRYGVSASPRVVDDGEAVPKGGGVYRVGNPYIVAGRTYVPEYNPHYQADGLASWYGEDFHGRRTANGEVFDLNSISAAHPTMPLPSYARVTNLSNGRSLIVRVNDRGPYHGDRIIDVSRGPRTCSVSTPTAPPGCGSNMSGARRLKDPTTGFSRRRCARTSRRRRRAASSSQRPVSCRRRYRRRRSGATLTSPVLRRATSSSGARPMSYAERRRPAETAPTSSSTGAGSIDRALLAERHSARCARAVRLRAGYCVREASASIDQPCYGLRGGFHLGRGIAWTACRIGRFVR